MGMESGKQEEVERHAETNEEEEVVFCQPPRLVDQGYVVAVQKTEYEVGYDIHYLCKKNFLLDGPQKRSRVLISGEKRWPFDVTDGMYKLFPHRLVSEIDACLPGDVE
ncbi:hypothetical protein CRUP_027202 [Coryphaenoides rupestris]|nr:hypothetical protein CRUP_027202 [Coryphaenoides rupestris]